jgi:hypothetical protein
MPLFESGDAAKAFAAADLLLGVAAKESAHPLSEILFQYALGVREVRLHHHQYHKRRHQNHRHQHHHNLTTKFTSKITTTITYKCET